MYPSYTYCVTQESLDMATPHKRDGAGTSEATLDILLRLREDTDGKLFEGATIEQFACNFIQAFLFIFLCAERFALHSVPHLYFQGQT